MKAIQQPPSHIRLVRREDSDTENVGQPPFDWQIEVPELSREETAAPAKSPDISRRKVAATSSGRLAIASSKDDALSAKEKDEIKNFPFLAVNYIQENPLPEQEPKDKPAD